MVQREQTQALFSSVQSQGRRQWAHSETQEIPPEHQEILIMCMYIYTHHTHTYIIYIYTNYIYIYKYIQVQVTEHWHRLSRAAEQCLSLVLWLQTLEQGVGTSRLSEVPSNLSHSAILSLLRETLKLIRCSVCNYNKKLRNDRELILKKKTTKY